MNGKIDEIIKYCARENLDKKRLLSFFPIKKDISKLPIYSLKEIDLLHDMIKDEYEYNKEWFSRWINIKSCYMLFKTIDEEDIGDDILELLLIPLIDLPLHVNEVEPRLNLFVQWRFKIGK